MGMEFDREFWEDRYRGHAAGHHGPGPYLVATVADLAPGSALDAGCGAGAAAVWLAAQGWRVTAVDIATAALRQAREHAAAAGADVVDRIDWVAADLTRWTPPGAGFDLVCSQYVHTAAPVGELVGRLAAAVAPGGTLLVVGHHPAPPQADAGHGAGAHAAFPAEEAAAGLDPERWEIVVAGAGTRPVTGPDGGRTVLHDAVLRARRRP